MTGYSWRRGSPDFSGRHENLSKQSLTKTFPPQAHACGDFHIGILKSHTLSASGLQSKCRLFSSTERVALSHSFAQARTSSSKRPSSLKKGHEIAPVSWKSFATTVKDHSRDQNDIGTKSGSPRPATRRPP